LSGGYPGELEENPQNWRDHPKAQEVAYKDAFSEVGWAGALLYNERTGHLIDGHLRRKATNKRERMPVLIGSWSEEEERKILLTLDTIGAMAVADKDALDELLASVRFESSALGGLLESLAGETAWQSIGPPELKEPADHHERADELRAKWKTDPEQVWGAGPHRIVCGDSRNEDVLAALWENVNHLIRLIWGDPPYGVRYGEKTEWMQRPVGSENGRPSKTTRSSRRRSESSSGTR